MVNYIFYQAGRPMPAVAAEFFAGPSCATTFAWRERMNGRLLGKTRSALMLLMFLTAQTHFSALAQPAPGGQRSALLASYAKDLPGRLPV